MKNKLLLILALIGFLIVSLGFTFKYYLAHREEKLLEISHISKIESELGKPLNLYEEYKSVPLFARSLVSEKEYDKGLRVATFVAAKYTGWKLLVVKYDEESEKIIKSMIYIQ